ncbi:MAG: tRNA glutamyl-Q(34) synthetase GluQRS [Burkholderiales bacterium]|nr:tRNA glutamyl-Q(34) synthetase GluQRS [Phycisphaerae bacterium]
MTRVTRLAPSPTGSLHLGNARTFLATWAMARHGGWRVILRIDDIDTPRVKPGTIQGAMDDLRWLGIDWDGEPTIQTHRATDHAAAIAELIANQKVYPCICTRKEIELAASAPHAEDGGLVYPGTCRDRFASIALATAAAGRAPALRLPVPDQVFKFVDECAGERQFDLASEIGDFVIAKPDLSPAYQLACVVGDSAAGVTDVIRADDLLASVPRQVLIYDALGLADCVPRYTHVPLVVGEDGKRLAKRHGDSRIATYREIGVPPGRVRALLSRWLGIDCGDTITADEVKGRFDLRRVPREPIIFTAGDEAWLRSVN